MSTGSSLNEKRKMASAIPWRSSPRHPMLGRYETHVWRADLDRSRSHVQGLHEILSADERARAGRFCFENDREHFVVARGLLRVILSRYLDIAPSQLRFCYGPYGKPSLVTTSDQETLSFNVSHSCGLALYAITRGRKVGVDLERIRPVSGYEQIVERFFSPREKDMLRAISTEEAKLGVFLNCWTRKEAYVKARGQGLALALDQFDVSLGLGEPAAVLDLRGDALQASRWSLQELIPGAGYVAALAVEGCVCRLACWEWRA